MHLKLIFVLVLMSLAVLFIITECSSSRSSISDLVNSSF